MKVLEQRCATTIMPPCNPLISSVLSSTDEHDLVSALCSIPSSSVLAGANGAATFLPSPAPSVIDPIKPEPQMIAANPSLLDQSASITSDAERDSADQANAVIIPSTLLTASVSATYSELSPCSRRASDASNSSFSPERNECEAFSDRRHLGAKSPRELKKRLRFDLSNTEHISHGVSYVPSATIPGDDDDASSSSSDSSTSETSDDSSSVNAGSFPSSPTASRSTTWWTRDELRTFKESAKLTCRKVRKRSAYTTCLDVAYQSATSTPSSLPPSSSDQQRTPQDEFHQLLHLGLAKWSTHGHSCRGLERRSSRYQFETRSQDITSVRQAVMEEQMSCNKRRRVSLDSVDGSCAADDCQNRQRSSNVTAAAAESIQRVSMERTERARLFARLMGQADAAAVGRG